VVFEEDGTYQDNELLIGTVDYDNEDGGIQATRHLMALGHRDIAFLGLHAAGHQANHQMGELNLSWSTLRQEGWSRVLQSAGQDTDKLSFLPTTTSPIAHESQKATAREVAVNMMEAIATRQITAVVAVNVLAAQGLIQAMQEASIPRENWPALVCFDDAPRGAASGISYLRLPWEKIGAEAAQLLWERRKTPGMKMRQHRLVKMNLVPSLTCRSDWALSGLAHQQVIQDSLPTPNVALGVSESVTV
jgi:LacI family transcriptional regulator